jgi:methylenetetrahydrofolate reductase (NADPH)
VQANLKRIGTIYQEGEFGLSIEVFPPKTEAGDEVLFRTLDRLSRYRPAFVSCTYGAGGSTQTRTVELCMEIQKRYGIAATAHFTCVGANRAQIIEGLGLVDRSGIRNVMALRGDPPQGQTEFKPVNNGLLYANELVELIREHFPETDIGVAGYPEKHPAAADAESDLQNLKRKVEAGANAVFTQLFYVNHSFFDFKERYEQIGIRVPLIPGIMPITDFDRIKRISAMCGATVPLELSSRLEAAKENKNDQFEIGIEFAIQQCRELIDAGIPGIHFYALNRSKACEQILDALGFTPTQAECA